MTSPVCMVVYQTQCSSFPAKGVLSFISALMPRSSISHQAKVNVPEKGHDNDPDPDPEPPIAPPFVSQIYTIGNIKKLTRSRVIILAGKGETAAREGQDPGTGVGVAELGPHTSSQYVRPNALQKAPFLRTNNTNRRSTHHSTKSASRSSKYNLRSKKPRADPEPDPDPEPEPNPAPP